MQRWREPEEIRIVSKTLRTIPPTRLSIGCCALCVVVIAGCMMGVGGCSGSGASGSMAMTRGPWSSPLGGMRGDGGGALLDPNDTSADTQISVTEWAEGGPRAQQITTPHFTIRTSIGNQELRRFIPIFLERGLRQYTNAICRLPGPNRALETYIFGSRDSWAKFTRKRLGSDADIYLGLGRGGYTTKSTAVLYDIGPNDTLTIVAHEGWHQYSQSVFREELPVWLEEGIATYMEGFRVDEQRMPVFAAWRNFERFGELREAVRSENLIPLRDLLERSPQQFLGNGKDRLLVYYAQVWALTHFLVDGLEGRHRAQLAELLQDAVRGTISTSLLAAADDSETRDSLQRALARGGIRALPGPMVASAYFGQNLEQLARDYEDFVQRLCVRGSGDAIWRGQMPASLRGKPVP